MNFEELYDQYKEMVYNLTLQYVQNKIEAEDITQEVFISVFNSIDGFRNDAKHSTWIYRITINKCLDFIKSKKVKKRKGLLLSLFGDEKKNQVPIDAPHFNHPGVLLENQEALDRLFGFINNLSESQKTVLILAKIEHLSMKEIANIMGLSVKAVDSLFQRAKFSLKEMIDQWEGNEQKYRQT